jgi:hypothetical protein
MDACFRRYSAAIGTAGAMIAIVFRRNVGEECARACPDRGLAFKLFVGNSFAHPAIIGP